MADKFNLYTTKNPYQFSIYVMLKASNSLMQDNIIHVV